MNNRKALIIILLLAVISVVIAGILAIQKRSHAREQRQVDEMDRKATEAKEKMMRPSNTIKPPPVPDGKPHGYEVTPIPTSQPTMGGSR